MPYIKQEDRSRFCWNHSAYVPKTAGELNYLITDICCAYLECTGKSYSAINDILGALEAAKLEFYRRVVVPYENDKIRENGDVF